VQLLVDIGNQRLKWALIGNNVPAVAAVAQAELARGSQALTTDEFFSSIDATDSPSSSPLSVTPPEAIWISSVSTGETTRRFIRYCRDTWNVRAHQARTPQQFDGLTNRYDSPAQLGIDRWLAAVGAYAVCCREDQNAGVIVVDAGTAVTVDVIHQDAFLGGAILPGVKLITGALGSKTGRIRLDPDSLVKPGTGSHDKSVSQDSHNTAPPLAECFTGTNSNDAVVAGAIAAICGGVRHCVEAAVSRFGSLPVVVSGGDGALVAGSLRRDRLCAEAGVEVRLDPDLVLLGLALSVSKESAP